MSFLSLQNLAIGYKKKVIADKLNITFSEKQIVCLLGANGCGKTTLLKTILGLLPPISGEVYLNNQNLKHYPAPQLAKQIAYVPQAHRHFNFSVQNVVLMGRNPYLKWYQSPNSCDKEIAQMALAQIGIEHFLTKSFDRLSGGEQQLVLIARALAQQPKLLIMDEPTSNLDFGNQLRVLEKIKQLNAETQLGILMTTHQPEQSLQVADRTLLFHQGKILADDIPQRILTVQNLAKIYQLAPAVIQKHFHFMA
ncbi:iron ABC transporter ATP-binding protein [Actinobacillus delphinicola]|uniref:ABC transporter ATP-binding protein n=1 Tax=Actinobacillus delphinicola TaxID=51161 RepID=UPI0024415DE8|nr:ABC transporter ATP-binding protein [Actinobacillus delphinicola]MDG6897901.1 iron ABC transporter ATP-binding protein [Actinobacillus delphinicola]